MPLRFLIGRARSGKTWRILDEVTAECRRDPLGAPILLLVPEQATYTAEKALLTHGKIDGYTRAHVLSFTRLAEYVFASNPAPVRPRLSPTHRDVLAALLVSRERRGNPNASLVSAAGMEEALADFVSEAREYATNPDDILRAVEALRRKEEIGALEPSTGMLETKLLQLAHLLGKFDAIVRDRFEDPHETLTSLAHLIRSTDMFQGATLYVDGFLGFTPAMETLLVALAQKVPTVYFALLGDPVRSRTILNGGKLPRHAALQPMEETLQKLVQLFSENGVRIGEPIFFDAAENKAEASRSLVQLERDFLARRKQRCDDCEGVEFHEVATPRQEARHAVELLARWMQEHRWHPEDVGILVRDLEAYASHLAEAFQTLRIPYFIDRHEPLETHPFVVGIQTLIRAALQPWDTTHLLALGKSGYLPVERRDVDLLEIHVRQFPRSMTAWYAQQPWNPPAPRSPFEEEDRVAGEDAEPDFNTIIEQTRRALVDEVESFKRDYLGAASRADGDDDLPLEAAPAPTAENVDGGRYGTFLWAIIKSVNRVTDFVDLPDADQRILRRIGELLGESLAAAGDEELSWDLAGDLVSRTLARLSLPRIPPMLGEVFVGQVDRSRQPRLKGVIVLGLSEGFFPRAGANLTLLNDQERDALQAAGLDLRPNSRKMYEREALYAYRAFTTSTERLALSRARAREDGSPMPPSAFWLDIRHIFDAPPIVDPSEPLHPRRVWRTRELAAAAVRLLDGTHLHGPRKVLNAPKALPTWKDDARRREAECVLNEARWSNEAALPAGSLEAFRENALRVSVSELESYSRCPFQHFVSYLLRPVETMKPEFEQRDAGNFAHAVMRNFTRALRQAEVLGQLLAPEDFERFIAMAERGPIARIQASGLVDTPSGRYVFGKLRSEVRALARWVADAMVELPFKPVHEEVVLKSVPDSPFHPYKVEDFAPNWNFEVRGQIDRIDSVTIADDDGPRRTMLVVDYKLRRKKFDFTLWEGGENLQLPVYMLAVNQCFANVGVEGSGGLYLDIVPRPGEAARRKYTGVMRSSLAKELFPGVKLNELPGLDGSSGDPDVQPRGSGTLIADAQFEGLLRRTAEQVREIGKRMIGGDIRVHPSRHGTVTACRYCSLRGVCRLDFRINRANTKRARDRREILMDLGGNGAP